MRVLVGILILVSGISSNCVASYDIDYLIAVKNYNSYKESRAGGQTDKALVKEFQKFFIKRVFLKPVFDSKNSVFKADEEDDEYSIKMSSANDSIYNHIMMEAVAEQLAEQDMMKLNKTILKEGKGRRSE